MIPDRGYLPANETLQKQIRESWDREKKRSDFNPLKQPLQINLPRPENISKRFVVYESPGLNTVLDTILCLHEKERKRGRNPFADHRFFGLMRENKDEIRGAADRENAKAQCVMSLMFKIEFESNASSLDYLKRSANQNFPRSLFLLAKLTQDQKQKWILYKKAVGYGEVLAMVPLGQLYLQQDPPNIDYAFSYFMAAGENGDANGYIKLGELYSIERFLYPVYPDYHKAEGYYRQARNLTMEPHEEMQPLAGNSGFAHVFDMMDQWSKSPVIHRLPHSQTLRDAGNLVEQARLKGERKQYEECEKQRRMRMTSPQEALLVHHFLTNVSKDNGKKARMYNFLAEDAQINLRKKGNLDFVVLGLSVPYKHAKKLLVEDSAGNIEQVEISFWNRLNCSQHVLLGKPGTKLIFKYYNRTIDKTGIPVYRIENANLLEIVPPSHNHELTVDKLKKIADTLLKEDYFRESLFIYNYLLQKGYEEKGFLYGKMGVCHLRLGEHENAQKRVAESQELDRGNAHAIRTILTIVEMHKEAGNFKQARELADNLAESKLKKELIDQLDILIETEENNDFSLETYRRKRVRRSRQLKMENTLSMHANFLQLGQYFRILGPEVLKQATEQQDWMKRAEQLMNLSTKLTFTSKTTQQLKTVATFLYEVLGHDKQQFCGMEFISKITKKLTDKKQMTFDKETYRLEISMILAERLAIIESKAENAAIDNEAKGKLEDAISIYAAFGHYNKTFALSRAELLKEQYRLEEAQQLSQQMAKRLKTAAQPNEDFLLHAARCMSARKLFQQSTTLCKSLFQVGSIKAAAYYLASLNSISSNKEQCLEYAYRASTLTPSSFEYKINLFRLLISKGQCGETGIGIRRLKELLEQIKNSEDVNRSAWQKACLNLLLSIHQRNNDLDGIIDVCAEMKKIHIRNILVAEQLFWKQILDEPDNVERILDRLKNNEELRNLAERLQEKWHQQQIINRIESGELTEQLINAKRELVRANSNHDEDAEQEVALDYEYEYVEMKREISEKPRAISPQTRSSLEKEFPDSFVACFYDDYDKFYVVLFGNKLGVDPKEEELCIKAAENGFCDRQYGENGIKYFEGEYELKLKKWGSRLVGTGYEDKESNRTIIMFDKRMGNHKKVRNWAKR